MKTLIIGRTATGKDTLQALLEKNYGWKFVKSMTTRPKRSADEDTHVFITEEEANAIPNSAKVAYTNINGYQYFATSQQVYEADGYIIDPEGARMLLKNMPEEWFRIVYLEAADETVREEMAIRRSDNPEKEIEVFKKRCANEDAQFSLFEKQIQDGTFKFDNCATVVKFTNNYEEKNLMNFTIELELYRRFNRNLHLIIRDLIDNELMNADEKGNPILIDSNDNNIAVRTDLLIEYLNENDAMLGNMMRLWLKVGTTDIPALFNIKETECDDI